MPTDADLDTALDTEATDAAGNAAGNAGADTSPEAGTDTTRAADETGEPKAVPYHRFQEVNAREQAYRQYGKPDEVADKMRRLAALEARDAKLADEARRTAEADERKAHPQQADAKDFVRSAVMEQFPELQHLKTEVERSRHLHVERGFEDLATRLEHYGLKATDDTMASFRRMLENEILADKAGIGEAFWDPATQRKAMDTAFERVKQNYIDPALRASGAKTLDAARARRARTLDRAAPTGTARATPATFTSTHAMGSVGYDRDRRAYRETQMDTFLDATDDEREVSL